MKDQVDRHTPQFLLVESLLDCWGVACVVFFFFSPVFGQSLVPVCLCVLLHLVLPFICDCVPCPDCVNLCIFTVVYLGPLLPFVFIRLSVVCLLCCHCLLRCLSCFLPGYHCSSVCLQWSPVGLHVPLFWFVWVIDLDSLIGSLLFWYFCVIGLTSSPLVFCLLFLGLGPLWTWQGCGIHKFWRYIFKGAMWLLSTFIYLIYWQ